MPDKEKVTHGLECCCLPGGHCNECPYVIVEGFAECTSALAKDALDLLKEQQQQIWELQDQVEYLTDKQKEQKFLVDSDGKITPLPEIVRCKDCVFGESEKNDSTGMHWIYCQHHRENRPEEWFCASGSRI